MRQVSTVDLDMTAGQFMQFTLLMGCDKKPGSRSKLSTTLSEEKRNTEKRQHPRSYGVLVQYSTDGGLTWGLLKVREKEREIKIYIDFI